MEIYVLVSCVVAGKLIVMAPTGVVVAFCPKEVWARRPARLRKRIFFMASGVWMVNLTIASLHT